MIDGADNCTYSIFAMTSKEFSQIFPSDGQDIEFIEDVVSRLGEDQVAALMNPIWTRMLTKSEVMGIHGTLFIWFVEQEEVLSDEERRRDDRCAVVNYPLCATITASPVPSPPAILSNVTSSPNLPVKCTPIGNPSAFLCSGRLIAGCPVTFWSAVKGM